MESETEEMKSAQEQEEQKEAQSHSLDIPIQGGSLDIPKKSGSPISDPKTKSNFKWYAHFIFITVTLVCSILYPFLVCKAPPWNCVAIISYMFNTSTLLTSALLHALFAFNANGNVKYWSVFICLFHGLFCVIYLVNFAENEMPIEEKRIKRQHMNATNWIFLISSIAILLVSIGFRFYFGD